MKNKIKYLIKRIIDGDKASSESYIKSLRNAGMRIGEEVVVYEPKNTVIDSTRPWLVEIGDNVKITRGVVILTHGYDWSVINKVYGDICGSSGKVKIGNNCFIGMNAVILKGVSVGNNVIIGAGSIVTENIPDNSVAVGNPARVICTLEEYRSKRIREQYTEAKEMAVEYKKVYNKMPSRDIFREHLWLFPTEEDSEGKVLEPSFEEILHLNGNYSKTRKAYEHRTPMFNSFEEFLNSCFNK